jgi:hypothetical protein
VENQPLSATDLHSDCVRVVNRLRLGAPVEEMEAITPNSAKREFEVLAKSIRETIDKNEPESGLDRLHTFTIKYLRVLCEKRGLPPERDKPLHSLMGEYVKCLKKEGKLESEMAERIPSRCAKRAEPTDLGNTLFSHG